MAIYKHTTLINYSADVLAEAGHGMTWTQIAKFFRKKSAQYKVIVPYATTIFPAGLENRRRGFIDNLNAFSREQQVLLLRELCDSNVKANITPFVKCLPPTTAFPPGRHDPGGGHAPITKTSVGGKNLELTAVAGIFPTIAYFLRITPTT